MKAFHNVPVTDASPLRLAHQDSKTSIQQLQQGQLRFSTGPFCVRLRSDISDFQQHFLALYQNHGMAPEDQYTDFNISIHRPRNARRWVKPQVIFSFDGHHPFLPLPLSQALPIFEWGFNWCVANHAHQYLQFHAAGLAKNGVMVLMPAPPGSGKSTLTAALMNNGWQLLSDEIVLIKPDTLEAVPIARPINLKNDSIDLLRSVFPDSYISDSFTDTAKGTVALMAPSQHSLAMQQQYQRPTHIIYPRYVADSPLQSRSLARAGAGIELMRNSFNYHMLGEQGFDTVCSVLASCECLELSYSDFDDAFAFFDGLSGQ